MFRQEYYKLINRCYLVHKQEEVIKSQNDYIVVGELEIQNKDTDESILHLTFKNDVTERNYKDIINTKFKIYDIPKDFMIVNEIGVRCRAFDNVKYFDYIGNLLFDYGWCE